MKVRGTHYQTIDFLCYIGKLYIATERTVILTRVVR